MEDTTKVPGQEDESKPALPIKLPAPIHKPAHTTTLPSAAETTSEIQKTIQASVSELTKVNVSSQQIQAQGGFRTFLKAGRNIQDLAGHLQTVTTVQEKSLDLLVMLLGVSSNLKENYDEILGSIEEASQQHGNDAEVIDYLVKIKRTVRELKERDDLLDSLITYTNDLRQSMEEVGGLVLEANQDATEAKRLVESVVEETDQEHAETSSHLGVLDKAVEVLTEKTDKHTTEQAALDKRLKNVEKNQLTLLRKAKQQQVRSTVALIVLSIVLGLAIFFVINNWT